MEMSIVSVHLAPWVLLAFIFLFFYPFVLWLSTLRASSAPGSASVVPAALTPLFAGLTAAWFGLNELLEGLALAGGGRSVRAAATAESLMILAFAALVAAVIAVAACVGELLRRRHPDTAPPMSPRWRVVAIVLISMVAFELYALSNAVTVIATDTSPRQPGGNVLLLAAAASAFLGAAASMIWLVASRHTAAARFTERRTACVLTAAAAAVIALTAWQVMMALRLVAIRG